MSFRSVADGVTRSSSRSARKRKGRARRRARAVGFSSIQLRNQESAMSASFLPWGEESDARESNVSADFGQGEVNEQARSASEGLPCSRFGLVLGLLDYRSPAAGRAAVEQVEAAMVPATAI